MTLFWCAQCECFVSYPPAKDDPHALHKAKIVGFDDDAFKYSVKRFIAEMRTTGRLIVVKG